MNIYQKSTIAAAFAASVTLIISCTQNRAAQNPEQTQTQNVQVDPVERGKYLVTIAGCNDCHSPQIMTPIGPAIDSSRMLSGSPENQPLGDIDMNLVAPGKWVLFSQNLNAAVGPWGVSFPRNLTPDTATGIGAWTEETFIKIIRSGKHMGSDAARPILPPMPWQNYALMSDEDLKATFAYLKAIPPVKNHVPEAITPDEIAELQKKK